MKMGQAASKWAKVIALMKSRSTKKLILLRRIVTKTFQKSHRKFRFKK